VQCGVVGARRCLRRASEAAQSCLRGDHTPFQWEGFAAVRLSTPNEIYANQHHATDLLENMSVPYTAKVAKVNGAVAASLALAPRAPIVMRAPGAGELAPRASGAALATRGR
jgi:hypothetical protein